MSKYFDTHAHFPNDAAAVEGLLDRASAVGVSRVLAVGGNPTLNVGARLAFDTRPGQVLLALGFDRDQAVREAVRAEAVASFADPAWLTVSAVGEIGLDYHYHHDEHERKAQRDLMECQLEIAARLERPVIVHTREADEDTLAILRNARGLPWFRGTRPGVIHCFTGAQAFADSLLELGYCLSFSGIVTFANADSLRGLPGECLQDRLLIETDSPFLSPVPLRGRPNEPANVPRVAACLAEQRDSTPDAIAALTAANALHLFG